MKKKRLSRRGNSRSKPRSSSKNRSIRVAKRSKPKRKLLKKSKKTIKRKPVKRKPTKKKITKKKTAKKKSSKNKLTRKKKISKAPKRSNAKRTTTKATTKTKNKHWKGSPIIFMSLIILIVLALIALLYLIGFFRASILGDFGQLFVDLFNFVRNNPLIMGLVLSPLIAIFFLVFLIRTIRKPRRKRTSKPKKEKKKSKKSFFSFLKRKSKPKSKEKTKTKTKIVAKPRIQLKSGETKIDALYRTITDKGKLSEKKAMDIFRVNKEIITDWAKVLESHELITISYPAFGSPVMKKKEEKEEQK